MRTVASPLDYNVQKKNVIMGHPVHRVRLKDVHAKLAIRWDGKNQNQTSIVMHQEVVIHYQSRVQQVR